MDPEMQTLGVRLAETVVRNTATSVADRIGAARARKRDQETIAELEEIVNDLIDDKSELVRIAQAYEQELVAQRISDSDVRYITENIVPVLKKLIQSFAQDGSQTAPAQDGNQTVPAQEMMDLIQPILSVETVTVLQLLGFNFRKAIGEPLTQLVSHAILVKAQASTTLGLEIQKLSIQRELAYLEVARDPEAQARLAEMSG